MSSPESSNYPSPEHNITTLVTLGPVIMDGFKFLDRLEHPWKYGPGPDFERVPDPLPYQSFNSSSTNWPSPSDSTSTVSCSKSPPVSSLSPLSTDDQDLKLPAKKVPPVKRTQIKIETPLIPPFVGGYTYSQTKNAKRVLTYDEGKTGDVSTPAAIAATAAPVTVSNTKRKREECDSPFFIVLLTRLHLFWSSLTT